MKRLLLILILSLSLQSWTRADDIRDFEIEGMSIGDSALDFFSKSQILDNIVDYYIYDDFQTSEIFRSEKFIKFESINFSFKKKDNEYKIVALSGFNFYKKNIKKCYSKMKVVDKEINYMFNNLERQEENTKHSADKSGKSTLKAIRYWFPDDSLISIVCYDWSDKITKEKRWTDNLTVEITTNEFNNWLLKQGY